MLAKCSQEAVMATITIRKVDEALRERLGLRARLNNRSLEAEVRAILSEAAPPHAELMAGLRDFQARMRAKHGVLPDSTPLIRQMRDEE
jgi:plasmid stability protein